MINRVVDNRSVQVLANGAQSGQQRVDQAVSTMPPNGTAVESLKVAIPLPHEAYAPRFLKRTTTDRGLTNVGRLDRLNILPGQTVAENAAAIANELDLPHEYVLRTFVVLDVVGGRYNGAASYQGFERSMHGDRELNTILFLRGLIKRREIPAYLFQTVFGFSSTSIKTYVAEVQENEAFAPLLAHIDGAMDTGSLEPDQDAVYQSIRAQVGKSSVVYQRLKKQHPKLDEDVYLRLKDRVYVDVLMDETLDTGFKLRALREMGMPIADVVRHMSYSGDFRERMYAVMDPHRALKLSESDKEKILGIILDAKDTIGAASAFSKTDISHYAMSRALGLTNDQLLKRVVHDAIRTGSEYQGRGLYYVQLAARLFDKDGAQVVAMRRKGKLRSEIIEAIPGMTSRNYDFIMLHAKACGMAVDRVQRRNSKLYLDFSVVLDKGETNFDMVRELMARASGKFCASHAQAPRGETKIFMTLRQVLSRNNLIYNADVVRLVLQTISEAGIPHVTSDHPDGFSQLNYFFVGHHELIQAALRKNPELAIYLKEDTESHVNKVRELVGLGFSVREIARDLGITERTVRSLSEGRGPSGVARRFQTSKNVELRKAMIGLARARSEDYEAIQACLSRLPYQFAYRERKRPNSHIASLSDVAAGVGIKLRYSFQECVDILISHGIPHVVLSTDKRNGLSKGVFIFKGHEKKVAHLLGSLKPTTS